MLFLQILGLTLLAFVLVTAIFATTRRIWVFHLYLWKYIAIRVVNWKVTNPELVRRFCEDMGPTFIKFGQIVASSSGMFPKRYVTEFQKCLDSVKPFGSGEVKRIIAEDLGEKAATLTVDEKPLASASIAQVHAAELAGEKVVVKVQRPGIAYRIDADMKIMRLIAWVLARVVKDAELANPVGIVEDFAATLAEELDFRKEAANCTRFNEIMVELAHADVHAPVPNMGLTTPRVLVMERFFGTRVDHAEAIRERGVNAEEKLITGMRAWFQCVLFYGFFHGDVHAGNLMLLDNGHLGFLDFGIVGRFSARQKTMVTEYIVAFATGDYKKLTDVIIEMGGVDVKKIDKEQMARDLEGAYKPLLTKSFQEINYAEMIPHIQRVASKHQMRLPKEFVLITKQMLYFDRYAKLLAPTLNVFTDPRLVMSLMADVTKARMMAASG